MNLDTTSVALDNPSTQFPLIHLNGNDGNRLGHQYFEALKALSQFVEVFNQIDFHSRDYYPLGDQSWEKAKAQRILQKEKIASLLTYLETHSQHCFESAR